jgi:hypothetical protein
MDIIHFHVRLWIPAYNRDFWNHLAKSDSVGLSSNRCGTLYSSRAVLRNRLDCIRKAPVRSAARASYLPVPLRKLLPEATEGNGARSAIDVNRLFHQQLAPKTVEPPKEQVVGEMAIFHQLSFNRVLTVEDHLSDVVSSDEEKKCSRA